MHRWLDEIDAAPGPPFLRMGTRALDQRWLLDGPDVPGQLAAKRQILANHHAEAVIALPGTESAGAELLALVTATVGDGDGGGNGDGDDLDGGGPPEPAGRHPLDAAGRLVAEDLCLLDRRDGGWVLVAGSVCFPSHWRLADKIGQPVAAVHGPVPHYAAELAARVDRFLDRLDPGRPVWRRNWTVHASPELFVPAAPPPPEPPVTVEDAGYRLWLRSERQTLRRLPDSGAVVFGIRTQLVRLRALARHPDLCGRLADAAAAWPDDLCEYKGGEAIRGPLVAALRALRERRSPVR